MMMAAVLVLGRAGPGFGLVLGRLGRGVPGGRVVNGGVGAVDSLRLDVLARQGVVDLVTHVWKI
jgi:hypothetical protein